MSTSQLKFYAIIAFVLCVAGGLVTILSSQEIIHDDYLWAGIGLYCIGKGIFVGPMLMSQAKS